MASSSNMYSGGVFNRFRAINCKFFFAEFTFFTIMSSALRVRSFDSAYVGVKSNLPIRHNSVARLILQLREYAALHSLQGYNPPAS